MTSEQTKIKTILYFSELTQPTHILRTSSVCRISLCVPTVRHFPRLLCSSATSPPIICEHFTETSTQLFSQLLSLYSINLDPHWFCAGILQSFNYFFVRHSSPNWTFLICFSLFKSPSTFSIPFCFVRLCPPLDFLQFSLEIRHVVIEEKKPNNGHSWVKKTPQKRAEKVIQDTNGRNSNPIV